MRRLLVFAALGPLLGFIVGFGALLPLLNLAVGGENEFDFHQIVLLPLAYALGLVPALLACAFDAVLARWGVRFRPAWCALAGFAVAFIPLLGSFAMGFVHGPFVFIFGIVGAIPAAFCSWLSSGSSPRAAAAS